MEKVIAFGAGNFYMSKRDEIKKDYDIIAFLDNDSQKMGGVLDDKPVVSVGQLSAYKDADILITSIYKYEIIEQLIQNGIDEDRIHLIIPEWMKKCDFVRTDKAGIRVCKDGVSAVLHNETEEMIYREIWYGEEYNVNLQEDSVLIDIGLNAGFATLFFAQKEFVKKVYAFEPDKIMYERARNNIEINARIQDKIETVNAACANEDREEMYVVNPKESAGIVKKRENTPVNWAQVKITCVDSAKILGAIIDKHYGKEKIVMKCDCEGAEYEIFYRLEETGYFNKIDVFIMEWHADRRQEIEKIFSRNNYTYLIFNASGRTFGKCYAVKSK